MSFLRKKASGRALSVRISAAQALVALAHPDGPQLLADAKAAMDRKLERM